jgi:hypothetical protein
MAKPNMGNLMSKGLDFVKEMPTAAKVTAGIGGAGLVTIGAGAIVGGNADRVQAKADRLERKAEAREGAGNNLKIAGAIATAGVGGYGIAQAISKLR